MHQKIQTKISRKGTLAMFFNNLISAADAGTEAISYLAIGLDKKPIRLADTEDQARFIRNANNNFELDTSVTIITGRTISQTLNQELNSEQQNKLRQDFTNKQSTSLGPSSVSAAFFTSKEVTDFFVSFGIERSVDVLNTLSVHNNVVGETPVLESPTGVLFGTLESIQKIKNENGEKIRIPLANVPVAIFTSSEEFPSVASTDDDGNRMALNLKENSRKNMYFNEQSYITDQEFLKDNASIRTIPQKYKHTAYTNEKGEFVLFDIPIGEQVFIFEIDLLKQGLTKDEVALNFFNYPVEESPNIDSVPNFFYRQIPVNVVPSWGDFQSGYTELNISVPLDLRKWSTYFVNPISFASKTILEMQNKGFPNPLTFKVRNMASPGFPETKRVELVEIDELLKKDFNQQLLWDGEFKQSKSKAEFRVHDYQAFKLPANLYDPDGIGTNGQKGVWLCAYQIKMYYQNEQTVYRTTGLERYYDNNTTVERSHFDLNRHTKNNDPATLTDSLSAHTGVFPYEKPWSLTYPNKYSIPQIPTKLNPNKKYAAAGGAMTCKEPKWLDGDRIGDPLSDRQASGYGLQVMNGRFQENLFSQRVTSGVVFKYEQSVRWDEQYSNGFHPILDGTPGNESTVVNGESYQRLEAGYGYWLKPEGWPRISNNGWGDTILGSDFDSSFASWSTPSLLASLSPPNYRGALFKATSEILTLKFDSTTTLRAGALDIYRVTAPDMLVPPGPPFIEKFVNIVFQDIYIQNEYTPHERPKMQLDNRPRFMRQAKNDGHLSIKNRGGIQVQVNGVSIGAGETVLMNGGVNSGMQFTLPGNVSFNPDTNSYDASSYVIRLYEIVTNDGHTIPEVNIDVNNSATVGVAAYYISSRLDDVGVHAKVTDTDDDGNITAVKCGMNDEKFKDVLINGIAFVAGQSSSRLNYVTLGDQLSPDCSDDIPIRFPGGHA